MSVLSRVSAPAATHDLAGVAAALFSPPERAAPRDLPGSVGDQPLGDENQPAASVVGRLVNGPTGLGTSAARVSAGPSTDGEAGSVLYCPPALRDAEALGAEVNDRLVDWAGQVGFLPPMVLVDPIAGYELPSFEFADRRVRRTTERYHGASNA